MSTQIPPISLRLIFRLPWIIHKLHFRDSVLAEIYQKVSDILGSLIHSLFQSRCANCFRLITANIHAPSQPNSTQPSMFEQSMANYFTLHASGATQDHTSSVQGVGAIYGVVPNG